MASAPSNAPSNAPPISQGPPGIMQQASDPLAELRDIHLPAPIETWPPAPGWWFLAALGIVGLLTAAWWLFRRWRSNQYRREALRALSVLHDNWQQHGDSNQYLVSLQQLLKRVGLTAFPREDVASLTGEAWVQFLDKSTGSHDFSMSDNEALIDGAYRQSTDIDVASLDQLARHWVRRHHPKHLAGTQTP